MLQRRQRATYDAKQRADEACDKGDYPTAIKLYTDLIEHLEKNLSNVTKESLSNIYALRSVAYCGQCNYQAGINDSTRALNLRSADDPKDELYNDLLLQRFGSYERLRDIQGQGYEKAIKKDCKALLKRLPNNPDNKFDIDRIHESLGRIAFSTGQFHEFNFHFSQLEQSKHTAIDNLRLAYSYLNLRDTKGDSPELDEKIFFYANQAAIKEGETAQTYFFKGIALKNSSPMEAIDYIRKSLEYDNTFHHPLIYDKLVQLYFAIGDLEKAEKYILRSIEISPERQERFTPAEYQELAQEVQKSSATDDSVAAVREDEITPFPQFPISAKDSADEVADIDREEKEEPSSWVKVNISTPVKDSLIEASDIKDEEEKEAPVWGKKICSEAERHKQKLEKLIARFPQTKLPPFEQQVFTWQVPVIPGAPNSKVLPPSNSKEIHRVRGYGLPRDEGTLFAYFDETSPSIIKLKISNYRAYEALKRVVEDPCIVAPLGDQGLKQIEIGGKKRWEAKILGDDGKSEIRILAKEVYSAELTEQGHPAATLLQFYNVIKALHKNKGR
jgi:tetratricopeptide (TPR) repeat protein